MTAFQASAWRARSILSWPAALLAPGALMLVLVLNIFTLLVWVVWTSIPAILLTVIGVRTYEFQEFGAMPKGSIDWALIVNFHVIAAFPISWVVNGNASH